MAVIVAFFRLGWITGISLADTAVSDWLYRWQTIIGSMIALAAALLGSYLLYRQIAQADRIEERRRERRFDAVRAVLPLSLSTLIEYAMAEALVLKTIIMRGPVENSSKVPVETVVVLKEFVEFAKQTEALFVRKILSDVQIHSARMREDLRGYPNGTRILTDTYLRRTLSELSRFMHVFLRSSPMLASIRTS